MSKIISIRVKSLAYNIILFLASVAFSLLILELVVRIVSPPSQFHPLLPLIPHNKMELHVNLKGLSPVAMHTTNKWGLRGDEPPSDWERYSTIIAVGGSTTQCFYIDDHKAWPYLLQEKLKKAKSNVWVGNGGLDGNSTRGHLLFMKEVIPKIRPKTVVFLTGINDLGISISEDRMTYGNPFDRPNWKYRVLASSRLVQILYLWKLVVLDDAFVIKKSRFENFEPKALSEEIHLPKDLKTVVPLSEYRENIRRIIQIGKTYNVRMIFLTQPMLFDDTEYWRKIEGEFYWIKNTKGKLSAATYWKLLNIYNKELLDTCRVEGVDCYDLASAVPHSDKYFHDSVHFTEYGAELVAEKLAEFLSKPGLLQN